MLSLRQSRSRGVIKQTPFCSHPLEVLLDSSFWTGGEENLESFSALTNDSLFDSCWALPSPQKGGLLIYALLTFRFCMDGENEQHVWYTLCGVDAI